MSIGVIEIAPYILLAQTTCDFCPFERIRGNDVGTNKDTWQDGNASRYQISPKNLTTVSLNPAA